MRIIEIRHDRMDLSVSYLYDKTKRNPKCPIYEPYGQINTKEMFFNLIDDRIRINEEYTGKKVGLNNTIKHAVVSFSPKDSAKLNLNLADVIRDTLLEIGLSEPEKFHVTGFVHNDKAHPHVHLIWSRIGVDNTKFNDKQIGKRYNEVANLIDMKYSLTKAIPSLNIKFKSNQLYNSTDRGSLYFLLESVSKEANNKSEFITFLKENKVVRTKNKNNDTIYILPNRTTINENTLPAAYRDENLLSTLKEQKLDKKEIEARSKLKEVLNAAQTLDDIKKSFPTAKITYEQSGDVIYNMSIVTQEYHLRLQHAQISNIVIRHDTDFIISQKPFIFTPTQNLYTHKDEQLTKQEKKNKRRGKELGLKRKL